MLSDQHFARAKASESDGELRATHDKFTGVHARAILIFHHMHMSYCHADIHVETNAYILTLRLPCAPMSLAPPVPPFPIFLTDTENL